MLEMGIIHQHQERYIAKTSHVAVSGLKQSGYFQKLYVSRLQSFISKATSSFEQDNALFWEMTYSVDPQKLPALKDALRETLTRFCEQAEEPTGKKVVSVACGMSLLN